MNSEQITAFLQEHWNWVIFFLLGIVLIVTSIMAWVL